MADNQRPDVDPDEPPDEGGAGWLAIDHAMLQLYPTQDDPLHYAPELLPPLGGDTYIFGISAYQAEEPLHWHLVTYGFSELYAKEWNDPEVSGWGFELTMRLPRDSDEEEPPTFALDFMLNLGRYVYRSGNPLGSGHTMDLQKPLSLGNETKLQAAAFFTDPQLGEIATPHGAVEFVQVVGITKDEYEACSDWQTSQVLEILRETNPLLLTDVDRDSVFDDPLAVVRLEQGIDRDGSQSSGMFVSVLSWVPDESGDGITVTMGAIGVQGLVRKLRSRLQHGREFTTRGPEQMVTFCPADTSGCRADEERLEVDATPDAVRAMLVTLHPERGTYTWLEIPGFTLVVVPSESLDSEGKVTEVIG